MRNFLRADSGSIATMFGVLMPLAAVAVSTAVEVSDSLKMRSQLQAAADAAALAGVRALADQSNKPGGVAESAAKQAAADFAKVKAPEATRDVSASAPDHTVKVSLQASKKSYFTGLIPSVGSVAAGATAVYDHNFKPCMLALGPDEPVGIELIGAARITAPKCGIQSNAKGPKSIYLQGAAKLVAGGVCASGGLGKAKTSPPAHACPPAKDPLLGKALHGKAGELKALKTASTYTGPCDHKNLAVTAKAKGTLTLYPGIYCGGLSIQSADVKLMPGLYTLQDGPLKLQANASLTGDAVSILLSGPNATLDLQGSPDLKLTAMTTGAFAGVAIAADNPVSPILTSHLQGSPKLDVTGAIYLPNQRLDMQGNPTLNLLGKSDTLVALSFQLQGSPEINIKSDFASGHSNLMVRLVD